MTVWLVRAGAQGENEQFALEQSIAVVGWDEVPSLQGCSSRDEVLAVLQQVNPNDSLNRLKNHAAQLWAFVGRIAVGDLVVLPLKTRTAIAIGRVTGQYLYSANNPDGAHHVRPVSWLRTDIPRHALGQDLLYSLGAFMTVCQISRHNAEQRVRAVMSTGVDPGDIGPSADDVDEADGSPQLPADLAEYARDQITRHVGSHFRGHELARLVKALLEAQGYRTYVASQGADGGADILAGRGPMGFDPPTLCVQVKSSDTPADVVVLRSLLGVMPTFGASYGLLVSWGGFKQSVVTEARQKFFQVRLMDAGELVSALLAVYDQLPEEIQAELPLKRIWTLAPEE